MDLSISITDAAQVLGLQRALAAQNAVRNVPLTESEFVQGLVTDMCAGFAQQHLVTNITQLAFLRRFTDAERVAIRTAAKSNAQVEDYLDLLAKSQDVDLTDPLTVGGVQALEAGGLIATGRAAEILTL